MTDKNSIGIRAFIPNILCCIFGNLIYFIFYHGNYPECGTACVIFFNIAFCCLFLPLIANNVHRSEYLVSGLNMLCWIYFFVETLLAICLLSNSTPAGNALLWQFAILAVFLVIFFTLDNANRKTDISVKQHRQAISSALLEAKMILNDKLTQCTNSEECAALRSGIADLSASVMSESEKTKDIEDRILTAANELASCPCREKAQAFSQLIMRRNSLIRILQQ